MPLSTEIRMPKDRAPVFPDRCVRCGAERPGVTYRITTHSIGWWTWAFWAFGRRFRVEVPACEGCRRRMRRQRAVRVVVFYGLACAGLDAAGFLFAAYRGPIRKWLIMGVALVCAAPTFLWEIFDPRPFDVTAHAETVDYEFRDPDYAEEFLALNGDVVEGDVTIEGL
jgi:hypothetical protein